MGKQYTIEKIDHQGRGIIKDNGVIIFAQNALPGETVEIEIIKEKRHFKEAQVVAYHKKSSNRIPAHCPYYNACGGCHIMHLSYQMQLEWKMEKIREIMTKFYSGFAFPICRIIESEEWNYRNKATFQVKQKLGYFEQKSNAIVPVDHCDLVDPKIGNLLPIIAKLNIDDCSQIVIRASKNTNQTMITFIGKNLDKGEIINHLSPYVNSIYLKERGLECIYGSPYMEEKIGNFLFKISPDSFFQVNTNQAKKLYDTVLRYADVDKEDSVLDLYCGTGTIGLYVSPHCHKVLGVEINEQAIIDANENKRVNGVNNIEFICGDVSTMVDKIKEEYHVVIVDPPRSGLDEKTLSYLKNCKAKRIVYVSCDPITLARDLNQIKEIYCVEELTPVDMFPQTYHVECVALLSLKSVDK